MVSIGEGPVQGDPEIDWCRVVGQAIFINYDVKFTPGFPVVQMESCRHGFGFAGFYSPILEA